MNRFFTLLLAASCLTAVGQVESICGCENENSLSVNLNLVAPEGFKLGEVLFASYGTPTGDCENGFATSDCHYSTTVSVIESYMSDCTTLLSVYPNNHVFGDPCGGTNKKLCVEIALEPVVTGCMNADACNYNPAASCDNGTCASCEALATACGVGTVWDPISLSCIIANPADINLDGCVQLNDLLDLLSAYGMCWGCGGGCSLANASSTCVDGECIIESCNDGFADYNGEALDGCESEEVPPWSCGEDLVFDGHAYATVQINGQCWFADNLRSTSYANGDVISSNLNDAAWSTTTSGGRATFGEGASVCYGPAPGGDACNEAFLLASYGRLYNWHAVNDARGLCPSGWHVPSDGEWTTLTDGTGGALTAGNTLKADAEWFNNGNGTSSNGFDAYPGGQRMNAGNFQGAGTDAFFWTSTAQTSVQVWFRSMGWNLPEVVRNPAEKNVGMSIRCIKDTE